VHDVLLISLSLAVTCDQQRSAVGPVIHIVLRPSNEWPHCVGLDCSSVRPFYTATWNRSRFQTFPFAFCSLFCYSGWSHQLVQVI